MFERFPHILKFTIVTGQDPYKGSDGQWVTPTHTENNREVECKAEPNGTGKMVQGEDGVQVIYSWLIFTDSELEKLGFGQEIKVYSGTELIASGIVKLHSRSRMNTRIWL